MEPLDPPQMAPPMDPAAAVAQLVELPVEPPVEPTALTCKCKAGWCPVEDCMRCRKCCSDHAEPRRKTGRPRKAEFDRLAAAKKPREGPASGLRQLPPVAYVAPSESEPEDESQPPQLWDLLRQLGFPDDKLQQLRKRMGGAGLRSDRSLWDASRDSYSSYERRARDAVVGLYADTLKLAADQVCGSEAADASLEFFFKAQLESDKGNKVDKSVAAKAVADTRQKLLEPWARVMAASKKGSIERRVVRAVLCQELSGAELAALEDAVPGFSINRSIVVRSRRDFELLRDDGVLTMDCRALTRFEPSAVDNAIATLMERDNAAVAAVGEKRFRVDGAVVAIPSIRRKRPIEDIYDDYKAVNGDKGVSRTSFYRLGRLITRGTMARSRNYSPLALDDSFARLARIVEDHLPKESELLAEKLQIVKDWLHLIFCDRANTSTAGCPRHDAAFRVSSASPSAELRAVTCTPCLEMYALQAYIMQRLSDHQAEPLTISVVDDCFHKMDLFTGYQLRVLNQQTAVSELFEQMRVKCEATRASSDALVVIDLRRKVSPMCYGDKPVEPDYAAGMSWNHALVRFWSVETSKDGKPVEVNVFFDHCSDQIDGKAAIVAMMEAMIVSIKRDLPQIASIAVQCDGGSSYQSSLLTVLLPVLGASNGLRVSRLIHTEARDGKSPIDIHVARAIKKAVSWVQLGNDCANPRQLVKALAADHGLPNSVAQLVEVDLTAAEQVVQQAAGIESAFSEIVGVVNDIVYDYPVVGSNQEPTALATIPSFSLRAFSYSGVGDGIEVEIRPQEGRCVVKNAVDGTAEGVAYSELQAEDVDDDDDQSGWLDEETVDESELGVDDEVEADHEVVLPSTDFGRLTHVTVVTTAQVRLRDRKWKATGSTTFLPVTRPVPQLRAEDEKDIVAYAKRALYDSVRSGRLGFFSSATLSDQMAGLCDGLSADVEALKPLVHAGSARRLAQSNTYGAKYAAAFKADILEILKPGQVTRWGKQAPARALEELQRKFPNRYDLPGEHDIRAEMGRREDVPVVRVPVSKETRRMQQQSVTADPAQPAVSNSGEAAETKRRHKLAPEYSTFLEGLVADKPSVKPLEALKAFHEAFPNAMDAPDIKVKAKVANLKTKALRGR